MTPRHKAAWILLLAFGIAIAVLSQGCVMVPTSHIQGTLAGQPFSIASPKDSEVTGLTVDVTATDQWGNPVRAQITIDSVKAKNNPKVISTTAEAQVQLIDAAIAGAGKIAGAAAKP